MQESKVIICAEYQGTGAVVGSTTGFQRSIKELINQAGIENTLDVIVYCMGEKDEVRRYEQYSNIIIKQYKPNLGIWDAVPFVPTKVFPFRVDMIPVHLDMIVDMIREKPDIVHSFQTFGATDLSGFVAAHMMKAMGRDVRLVNTVMTEIDTYFGNYVKNMSTYFSEQIDTKSFSHILRDSAREGSVGAAYEGNVSITKMIGHAAPLAFWYGLATLFGAFGKRDVLGNMLSAAFRRFLGAEIPAYMNRCDAITVSRSDDVKRYNPRTTVWDVPLTCDLTKFRVYDPDITEFIAMVDNAYVAGLLTQNSAAELRKFVNDSGSKRPILYVGRLSDEKNVSFLVDSYARLLELDRMAETVHFVFIGAGEKADNIKEMFGANAIVSGLVPNDLLPDIYNFVRQRRGYFISASDTETYGITHEEAKACGVPTVAMQTGTRNHIFCPGDSIGGCLIMEDKSVSDAVRVFAGSPDYRFIPGLNGIVIPDYSGGRGLSAMPVNHESLRLTLEDIFQAMCTMSRLPDKTIDTMACYAAQFTEKNSFGWSLTWQLFRHVYSGNGDAHATIFTPRQHSYS